MKKLLMILSLFATMSLYSCEANKAEGDDNKEEPKARLTIEANKQTLMIDDGEVITFSVLLDGKEVTAGAQIVDISDDGFEYLKGNTFTTLRPGTHTFYAEYDDAVSDVIAIMAISETNISNTFYRRNLVLKFTATWCTNCPQMTNAIKGAEKLYPDRLLDVAVHITDDYQAKDGETLYNFFGVSKYGLPTCVTDMSSEYLFTSKTSSAVVEKAKASMEDNPTVAGIKAESKCVDGELSVDIEALFTKENDYKILTLIRYSGFTYGDEVQENILFTSFPNIDGELIQDIKVNEKIQRNYKFGYEALFKDQFDPTKADIVVCVLNRGSNGQFSVNNAISLGFEDSVDYQYEPIVE